MQRDSENYIIGGGISGLVFQFYHPDFQIITPDIGGMYGKTYMVWLHDTPETRKFLKDLGYDNPAQYTTKSWIGYWRHGWISEQLTPELNTLIIQKKMTRWNELTDKTFQPKSLDISTTTQNTPNYLKTLDINLEDLIQKLAKNAKYQIDKVSHLNSEFIFTESGKFLTYQKCISTIPAPIFWRMWVNNAKKEFKSCPITNIITDTALPFYDKKFAMIYYADTVPFSRVSYMNGKYGIEFTGEITKEEFQKLYPEINIIDYVKVPFGRIFDSDTNRPPLEKITFLGRFATWKFGTTTEHVIKQSLEHV